MALVDFQIHYKVLPGPFHFAEGTLGWDQLHGFVEAMYEVTGNGIDQAIQSGKFEGDHKFQALFQKHESGWRPTRRRAAFALYGAISARSTGFRNSLAGRSTVSWPTWASRPSKTTLMIEVSLFALARYST